MNDNVLEQKLRRYLEMALGQNKTMDLTAITDWDEAYVRHINDSLALLKAAAFAGMSVIDIGAGGGFPGVPLKLAEPSVRLTLLDATAKKIDFLRRSADELGLDGVVTLHGRAEELAVKPPHREAYDIAVSRGVAKLNVLAELCLPFVKTGGLMLAMKQNGSELPEALDIIAALGGQAGENFNYELPGGLTHTVIKIKKIKPTPVKYPRRFAKIDGRP